ncbi:hypothetical protein QAD02_012897, partial [Eretmocerus hayati]
MSPKEATAFLIDLNLTVDQYLAIRSESREHGHDWLPPYAVVLEAKKEAYPDNITVTETGAEVDLQSLLHHAGTGIVEQLIAEGVIENVGELVGYTLVLKGGFDATHVTEFNQKCLDPEPVRFQYLKETKAICKREADYLRGKMKEVQILEVNGCQIDFEMISSMVDGKVCNFLNNSSSQRCFVCKETISKFNDIELVVVKQVDETQINNGLTVMHTRIRSMELVLYIAERLVLPKRIYKVPKALKPVTKKEGRRIQQCLKSRIGVVVNKPKPGFGNTNSGNTARKFFKNCDIVAEITGFDVRLLVRIATILGVISCGEVVNIGAFREYGIDTARRFVEFYDWYYMPTTLHLILIHGYLFLRKLDPAMGLYSEEPLESSHKVLKSYRNHRARRCD